MRTTIIKYKHDKGNLQALRHHEADHVVIPAAGSREKNMHSYNSTSRKEKG